MLFENQNVCSVIYVLDTYLPNCLKYLLDTLFVKYLFRVILNILRYPTTSNKVITFNLFNTICSLSIGTKLTLPVVKQTFFINLNIIHVKHIMPITYLVHIIF